MMRALVRYNWVSWMLLLLGVVALAAEVAGASLAGTAEHTSHGFLTLGFLAAAFAVSAAQPRPEVPPAKEAADPKPGLAAIIELYPLHHVLILFFAAGAWGICVYGSYVLGSPVGTTLVALGEGPVSWIAPAVPLAAQIAERLAISSSEAALPALLHGVAAPWLGALVALWVLGRQRRVGTVLFAVALERWTARTPQARAQVVNDLVFGPIAVAYAGAMIAFVLPSLGGWQAGSVFSHLSDIGLIVASAAAATAMVGGLTTAALALRVSRALAATPEGGAAATTWTNGNDG